MNSGIRRYISLAALFAGAILLFRYFLPLVLPFLLGAGLAIAAEPLVGVLCHRVKLKRPFATAIGVSMAFSFLALAVMVLCAFLIRQIRSLTGLLPQLETALHTGMDAADRWLVNLSGRVPGELGTVLTTISTTWVKYEEIPQYLKDATVAIEDKRFWTHPGVDWRRTGKAVMSMFTGGDIQGDEAAKEAYLDFDGVKGHGIDTGYVLTKDSTGEYVQTYVTTGINDGSTVQIVSGLHSGQAVYYPAGIDIEALMKAMRGGM